MCDWIEYDGKVAPTFEDGTLIEVRLRDGEEFVGFDALEAYQWDWDWVVDDPDSDIVAYRIKGE